MPLIDSFTYANNAKLSDYQPWYIHNHHIGYIRRTLRATLADYGLTFTEKEDCLYWQPIGNFDENSAFLAEITQKMEKTGFVHGWRDELYPIASAYNSTPYALIERAALPILGCKGYGVHLNGLVKKADRIYMWIARRAANKPTSPNKLDQIAAGGLPYGISAFDNLQKECAEEAAIPFELSRKAIACGVSSYYHEVDNGIRADVMFHYDLWLPESFTPHNTDGEVAAFYCLPIEEVLVQLENQPETFKYNSAIVMIDCAIRHGLLTPDNTHNYTELCAAMCQH
ncbi:NUDIX hydrolase [Suttonella ornithocola]|uniref:DUF4743 domain-containing protein n=1 Tax=Suttonella ornithocola TaxID=279832 RepID=A0A380MME3_9GAMM|nr:DUF4743 domain-containing protein [Suttonella ornithocola]SUO93354.1 Uncharacterised protein [Suttonella ornithocola]